MTTDGLPPNTTGTRLAPAGIDWDAVKVSRFVALQALRMLSHPGSVAVDSAPAEPALYFFVPPGSATGWDVQQSTVLGAATHVALPPNAKERPPGPFWLIAPKAGRIQLTRVDELRTALDTVTGATAVREAS